MLVGDSVQGLGDVQEGVAAVHNPGHFLGTGSKFVIHQLRERFPQLVLVTWEQNQTKDSVEGVWVWSQCKAATFSLGLEFLLQGWSEKEKGKCQDHERERANSDGLSWEEGGWQVTVPVVPL